jgi:hypothetical protein
MRKQMKCTEFRTVARRKGKPRRNDQKSHAGWGDGFSSFGRVWRCCCSTRAVSPGRNRCTSQPESWRGLYMRRLYPLHGQP